MATISPLRTAFEAKRPRPWIGLLAIRVFGERYEAGMGTSYVKSGGSGRRSSPDTPPHRSPARARLAFGCASRRGASAGLEKGWLGSPSAASHTAIPDSFCESGG